MPVTFKRYVIVCLILMPFLAKGKGVDTLHIYFSLNKYHINAAAEKTIDSSLYEDMFVGKNIWIIGYADYLGDERANNTLSIRRSKAVKKYLVKYGGVSPENIRICIGKGEIKRQVNGTGYPKDRRVDILLLPSRLGPLRQRALLAVTVDTGMLSKVPVGQSIILENILFYANRHTMTPKSKPALDMLCNELKENPGISIQIEGHICCVRGVRDAIDEDEPQFRSLHMTPAPKDSADSLYYGNTLSRNRAIAVYLYLIRHGISPDRLTYKGFGHSRPLIKVEKTQEDRARNRRVEIRVLKR